MKSGYQEIIKIHNALYVHLFDTQCQPYIPHMTIGKLDTEEAMEDAYHCIKNMDLCFKTVIKKVSVEMIGPHGESIIVIEKDLHSSIEI